MTHQKTLVYLWLLAGEKDTELHWKRLESPPLLDHDPLAAFFDAYPGLGAFVVVNN